MRLLHVALVVVEMVTEPLQVPLVGVTVSQLQTPVTVQVQVPGVAVTLTLVLPPLVGAFQLLGEME